MSIKEKPTIFGQFLNSYYFVIFSLIFITVISVLTNRFLYADGSYFFYKILSDKNFFVFDKPRIFAQYITQFPTVVALDIFHINDKDILLLIYGSTLYGIPFLGIVLTAYFIENKELLWIPLLSFYFASVYSYSFIISEAHTMNTIFWILLVLITRKKIKFVFKILTIILLGMASHMYESFMFLSIILGLLTLFRIKNEKAMREKFFWIISFVIIIYGFYIALNSYLYPRDPTNANGFVKSISYIFKEGYTLWFLSGGLFITSFFYKFFLRFNIWIILTVFICYTTVLFINPHLLEIEKSYPGRTLLFICPFIFSIFYLCMLYVKKNKVNIILNKIMINSLSYIGTLFFAIQLVITFQWYGYTKIFSAILSEPHTEDLIDYRKTLLAKTQFSNQLLAKFNWSWTFPFMSYALSDNEIMVIIENKNNHCCMSNPAVLLTKVSSQEVIPFNSKKVIFINWSQLELTHRWSLGKNSEIRFRIKSNQKFKGILHLHFGTLGEQEIKIYLNDKHIGDIKANGWDIHLSIKFNPNILNEAGINILKFEYSNPHKPNNGDQRVLAMAFKDMVIE